jgi:Flp pilus assembly protein TadD
MNRQQRRAAAKGVSQAGAENADLLAEKARSLLLHGDTAGALPFLKRLVLLRPQDVAARRMLGQVLVTDGRAGAAVAELSTAFRHQPDDPELLAELAVALQEAGRSDQAQSVWRGITAIEPAFPGAMRRFAATLKAQGKYEAALAVQRRAVAVAPREAVERFNLSLLLLALGRFEEGWECYEARQQVPGVDIHTAFRQAQWAGETIDDQTLLVHAEQGLGDVIQFCRYLPLLQGRAGRILFAVPRTLATLLAGLPGVDAILTGQEAPPSFDRHCPLLSLPRAFGTTLETIPAEVPYLFACRDRARAVAARFPALTEPGTIKVGLVWAGESRSHHRDAFRMDLDRSIRLADLASLGRVRSDVRFVSLQAGRAASQAAKPPAGLKFLDPMQDVTDFADTAAIVEHLDLVISVDTAVAHLAGAMGKPVWILSRFDGCWRWLRDRDDTPWYPKARLFRQTRPGDWGAVIKRVKEELGMVGRDR